MKKIIALLMLITIITSSGAMASGTLNIVATTFPQYDWLREIMGDKANDANITLLVGSGSDIHNYQPAARDIITISTCDMIVYVGGASDMWVDEALQNALNPAMVKLSMLGLVEAREEELVDGMQGEEEEEGVEYDEHVWLSLKNARIICEAIARELGNLDPANASYYAENAAAYREKLAALDAEYAETVESSLRKTVLFADRFPFRYLADDYGIDYYAAFAGCSAETEASFETVAFLAEKLDELDLPAALVIEGGNHDLARTIVSSSKKTDRPILEMNSIQSVTDINETYLGIMEENLSVLKTALN